MIYWDASLDKLTRREILENARAFFRNNPSARSCDVHHVFPIYEERPTIVTHITRSDAASAEQRRERDSAMRDLGLVKVRGALGGVYWE